MGWCTKRLGSFSVYFAFGLLAWRTRIWNAGKIRSVGRLVQTKVEGLGVRHEVLIYMYEFESGASSIPRTDSEDRRVFGMNNAVSKF